MDKPLISVIVPVYKVEEYLDRCVESLVNQTYDNIEIILVDDGSPDKCPHICNVWAEKDSHIKVIHKENGGLSDARNAGMKVAHGDYISFVDSDDLVNLRFLEVLYDAIAESDAELAACDVVSFSDENDLKSIEIKKPNVENYTPEQALSLLIKGRGFRAVAWNKLYKADILKDESFEVGKLHEDEFFTYRIFDKCKKLSFVNIPLYFYRQREGSIMTNQSLRRLDGLEAGFDRLVFLEEKYPELYRKDKVTYCIGCINGYRSAVKGTYEDNRKAKRIINGYRRKLRFSIKELLHYGLKDKFYILLSSPMLIGIFSRIRNKG